MSVKLYVGNLSFNTTEQDLQDNFSHSGLVQSVSLITDRETGRSRGFAFVEMDTRESADAAIKALNGATLDERALTVNEAKPKEDRGGSRNGASSGGYGRSRY
ncbi:MAG: RNA recognition motif domain-containing protein [Blastocatellia bacterium]